MELNKKQKQESSERIFQHLGGCEECQKRWQEMGLCSGVGNLNSDNWGNFCEHIEVCKKCQINWSNLNEHIFYEITVDDISPFLKLLGQKSWGDTPYNERQVYAAASNVSVEVCLSCPYLEKYRDGFKNRFGQPGICHYCRSSSERLGMKGEALC
jgi:hypothetical protein